MSVSRPLIVTVIGAAICTPEQSKTAETVGRLLAESGAILACGGRGGVMEAACRGATQAGGFTIGFLPGIDPREGNPYLTAAIPTGLGHARNAIVVQAGQAIIAIGGGYGTLSEIGMALKSGRRVIGLGTWRATNADGQSLGLIEVRTPEEAVDLALEECSNVDYVG